MIRKTAHIILLLVGPLTTSMAQFSYELMDDIDVIEEGELLSMPWAGGINSVQINMLDFTGDGQEDLLLFERTSRKIRPMERVDGKWEYRPDFIEKFPEITGWVLLRDFNNDGKKDIFTSHPLGIKVYVNETEGSGELTWREFNEGKELTTMGINGPVNIAVGPNDIPAIDDINGDGSLDILSIAFLASSLEYNQNSSVGDTLMFEKITTEWGDFRECNCGSFSFGEPCAPGGRLEHSRPKSILTYDMDGDGDKDVALSEELCSEIFVLENVGDADNAIIRNPSITFPNNQNPVRLFYYPSGYFEDIDGDDKTDLIVTTNITTNYGLFMDFRTNVHFYKNLSATSTPSYQLVTNEYLHDQMIDVGEASAPAFADVDYDGDEDMVVGQWGSFTFNGRLATLYLYENIGTNSDPIFELKDRDWLQLSRFSYYNIKPQFVDINGDQNLDIAFTASPNTQFDTYVYYLLNNSFWGFDFSDVNITHTGLIVSLFDNVYFYDYDKDNDADILLGESSGRIRVHKNVANENVIGFLPSGDFYNMGQNSGRPYPSIAIGDLNGNEIPELVIGARNGHLSIYPDFELDLENKVDSVSIELTLDGEAFSDIGPLGTTLSPSISKIYNNDLPTLVIGNAQGGLSVLKNNNSIPLPENSNTQLTPTLVQENNDEVVVESNLNVAVEFLTLKGQKLTPIMKRLSGSKLTFPVSDLAPGMYIARIYYGPESVLVKKIVVTR